MDINKKNRSDLKSYFVKNSIPTQSNFEELIDGMLNQKDDGIVKSPDALCIEATGDLAGLQRVINFYSKFQEANHPAWSLQLNPRTDANDPATAKTGFCVADGAGAARLFIDKSTGNIGVGVIDPKAKLDIAQGKRTDTHPTNIKGLYITGDFGEDKDGIEFRLTNGSQGIGFGCNTIYAAGSDANQDLQLKPKGTGKVKIHGDLDIKASQIKFDLTANGGGQLIVTNTTGDKISLEGRNKDGTRSADELLLTGKDGGKVSKLSLMADMTLIMGKLNVTGDVDIEASKVKLVLKTSGGKKGLLNVNSDVSIDASMINLNLESSGVLRVNGVASIYNGYEFGYLETMMSSGSLAIGSTNTSYGGGTSGINSNTAGLLLQTEANTEIAVRQSGIRLASLMYYDGTEKRITIGRDMGGSHGETPHGVTPVTIAGDAALNGCLRINKDIKFKIGDEPNGGIFFSSDSDMYDNPHAWLKFYDMSPGQINRSFSRYMLEISSARLAILSTEIQIKGDLTINGLIISEQWIDAKLENGWVPYKDNTYQWNSAGFFKDKEGIVWLRGMVSGGVSTIIFTLPEGYRPSNRQLHVTTHRVDLTEDGKVVSSALNPGWLALDGISFRAAQ